jgi:hypothetical protein
MSASPIMRHDLTTIEMDERQSQWFGRDQTNSSIVQNVSLVTQVRRRVGDELEDDYDVPPCHGSCGDALHGYNCHMRSWVAQREHTMLCVGYREFCCCDADPGRAFPRMGCLAVCVLLFTVVMLLAVYVSSAQRQILVTVHAPNVTNTTY